MKSARQEFQHYDVPVCETQGVCNGLELMQAISLAQITQELQVSILVGQGADLNPQNIRFAR